MNIHTLADVRTYSVQYSDKVRFPQLRIKCDVAKSCLGTHTVPMTICLPSHSI